MLGALFGDRLILSFDKFDSMLIHEHLYVPQQRVVLALDEVDFLLENNIQIRVVRLCKAHADLTWWHNHRS